MGTFRIPWWQRAQRVRLATGDRLVMGPGTKCLVTVDLLRAGHETAEVRAETAERVGEQVKHG